MYESCDPWYEDDVVASTFGRVLIMAHILDPLAKTALWAASMRARENARVDRLFSDPLAALLAGDEGLEIMREFEGNVQKGVEDPALAVRTRFLDDELIRLSQAGIRQFVFPAAGMDARAFRLTWPGDAIIFELDRLALLQLKDDLIARTGASTTCKRIAIGVDLLNHWTAPLQAAGFDPAKATVWLVEGLLYFLDVEERDTIVREISSLSAHGSWFLADYVSHSTLASPDMREWRERMVQQGHPWKSGCDNPEQFMVPFGWNVRVIPYGQPSADYGRWQDAVIAPGTTATRGRYLIVSHLSKR